MKFDNNPLYFIESTLLGNRYSLFTLASWKNGLPFKKIDFSEKGKPIIKIAELNNGISNSTSYTDKEYSSDVYLKKGDFVFSWSGNPDTSIDIFRYNLPDGWLNQHIFKVVPEKGLINKEYFFYVMKYLKPQFRAIATNKQTTGLGHVTIADLQRISVVLPCFEIQLKIASILKTLDDKIELNQKINDNLEEQAQAIFENWLAECDEKITIGELCENILDYSKCTNNEVVLINSSDVTNGHFEHHTLSLNSNLKGHFKKRFKKWDILFSEIRPRNHHFAYCQFDPTNYIASTRLMVLRNRSSMISSSLLYRYLMLNDVLEEFILKTESRSGTFPQGCFEDLSRITVSYSPIKRQEEINGAIEDIHSLSWNIEKENQQLSAIRDSLLPRLMSGELDVSNLEI